jgi:hypothetical protein
VPSSHLHDLCVNFKTDGLAALRPDSNNSCWKWGIGSGECLGNGNETKVIERRGARTTRAHGKESSGIALGVEVQNGIAPASKCDPRCSGDRPHRIRGCKMHSLGKITPRH